MMIQTTFQSFVSSVGGYEIEPSPAFLAAEEKLFADECKDVDVLITTAVTPGKLRPPVFFKCRIEIILFSTTTRP